MTAPDPNPPGTQKANVSRFNADVKENDGYKYTTNASYSSYVANLRQTDATVAAIPSGAKTVIDIGCGDGTYTHELSVRLPGLDFTGFDPAAEAIGMARRKFKGVEYLVGDLLDVATFPDRKFDLAVVRGVIHHLPNAALGIANAGKLGNRVLLIEPNGNNPILKWLEKNSRYHIEHEEQSYTEVQLGDWCRQAGYTVKRVDFIGFVPFFFPTFPAQVIHFFQPMLELIPPLKKWFGAQIVMVYERE